VKLLSDGHTVLYSIAMTTHFIVRRLCLELDQIVKELPYSIIIFCI
jgi:hypothetical protein